MKAICTAILLACSKPPDSTSAAARAGCGAAITAEDLDLPEQAAPGGAG